MKDERQRLVKEPIRLEFSNVELQTGDLDWKVRPLRDFYLIKLFRFANEMGLNRSPTCQIAI